MRKIGHFDQADVDDVKVTLFRNAAGEPCGWFIGPLSYQDGRFALPFLAETEETMAQLAVVRALAAAKVAGLAVVVIDPEDLWTTIWRG